MKRRVLLLSLLSILHYVSAAPVAKSRIPQASYASEDPLQGYHVVSSRDMLGKLYKRVEKLPPFVVGELHSLPELPPLRKSKSVPELKSNSPLIPPPLPLPAESAPRTPGAETHENLNAAVPPLPVNPGHEHAQLQQHFKNFRTKGMKSKAEVTSPVSASSSQSKTGVPDNLLSSLLGRLGGPSRSTPKTSESTNEPPKGASSSQNLDTTRPPHAAPKGVNRPSHRTSLSVGSVRPLPPRPPGSRLSVHIPSRPPDTAGTLPNSPKHADAPSHDLETTAASPVVNHPEVKRPPRPLPAIPNSLAAPHQPPQAGHEPSQNLDTAATSLGNVASTHGGTLPRSRPLPRPPAPPKSAVTPKTGLRRRRGLSKSASKREFFFMT